MDNVGKADVQVDGSTSATFPFAALAVRPSKLAKATSTWDGVPGIWIGSEMLLKGLLARHRSLMRAVVFQKGAHE
jgi:hypothetical protein